MLKILKKIPEKNIENKYHEYIEKKKYQKKFHWQNNQMINF